MTASPASPETVADQTKAAGTAAPASAPTHEPHGEAAIGARNRLVIFILLISVFVMILNETIMGVALPTLTKDLGITAGAAQWLTAAFLLTMAVTIPVTGFLLQRFNTRPLFIAAMGLFSLGTLLAAVAPASRSCSWPGSYRRAEPPSCSRCS